MLDKLYDNTVLPGERCEEIKSIVKLHIDKTPIKIIKIAKSKMVYKLIFDEIPPIRLDDKWSEYEITKMQEVAYENGIEIPKVIKVEGLCKYSEWITGVLWMRVFNLAEAFYKAGYLMGRMNLIEYENTGSFLTNGEFSPPNAVWTNDNKMYVIDHGRMRTSKNPDMSVVQVVLKRIRDKERTKVFLSGYSQHRNIDSIMKIIKEKNWIWESRKPLKINLPSLEY